MKLDVTSTVQRLPTITRSDCWTWLHCLSEVGIKSQPCNFQASKKQIMHLRSIKKLKCNNLALDGFVHRLIWVFLFKIRVEIWTELFILWENARQKIQQDTISDAKLNPRIFRRSLWWTKLRVHPASCLLWAWILVKGLHLHSAF